MPGKILATSRAFCNHDGPHKQILFDAGYKVILNPHDRTPTEAELAAMIVDCDAAVFGGAEDVTARVIDASPRLRVISRFGVGYDRVDIAAATRRKIPVTITPGTNHIAVAELAFGLMMALARQIPFQDRCVRQGGWPAISGFELAGASLGIIGAGRIGREVASRALAFGMQVLFHDPVPPPPEFLSQYHMSYRALPDLLAESDIVTLHTPLLEATRHLINAKTLELMKPTAFLINAARGDLVDEAALLHALQTGQIAGAACDVFAVEPAVSNPLLKLDNFIATAHNGSGTVQTTLRMGLMASQNVLAVLRGEKPEHVVNPEVFE